MPRAVRPEARVASLIEALPYIQKYRGATFVIKYGGAAMEQTSQVDRLLRDIVFLEAVGINPVVVHGGGKAITARMRQAGIQPRFVNGLRVTDADSIRIVEETLDREINPGLVAKIESFGGRARGFSGRTVFKARKMDLVPVENGAMVDVGFVGEAADVNSDEILATVHEEIVPIISPIGADENGQVLNINADIAAAALAAKLGAEKLIYVSDVPGIMRDPQNKESLIPSVTCAQARDLIEEQVIEGGMIPKVTSAMESLQQGVGKVHFVGGHIPHCLLLEIFTDSGVGTEVLR